MKHQQCVHQRIATKAREQRFSVATGFLDDLDHSFHPGCMKLQDGCHKIHCHRPGSGVRNGFQSAYLLFYSERSEIRAHDLPFIGSCPMSPNMGTCRVSSSFPLPVYMCTPHGRQGSKLRTARMMSTPLNLSGPFSSKIGVFCTASS